MEYLIKDLSKELPNTYVIGLFSCYRQIVGSSFMKNCASSQDATNQLPDSNNAKTLEEEEVELSLSATRPDPNYIEPVKYLTA